MLANWVRESTATTGVGAITLGGAGAGFVPFSAAFTDGARVSYAIEDGNNREIGIGTYSAGVLSRTTVLETLVAGVFTRGGAAITLSGSAIVIVTMEASLTDEGRDVKVWLRSGAYYDTPDNYGASNVSGNIIVADTFYSVGVLLLRRRQITTLYTDVKTANAAATQLAIGIYSVDPTTGLTGNIITEVMLSGTATGSQGALVPGGPITLEPGWYLTGFLCNAAPQILSLDLGAVTPGLSGIAQFDNYRQGARLVSVTPGWSGLPASPGTPTGTNGSNLFVLMWR